MRSLVRSILRAHDRTAARLRAYAAEPAPRDPDLDRTPTVGWQLDERLCHNDRRLEHLAAVRARDAALMAEMNRQVADLDRLAAEQEQRWADLAADCGWN